MTPSSPLRSHLPYCHVDWHKTGRTRHEALRSSCSEPRGSRRSFLLVQPRRGHLRSDTGHGALGLGLNSSDQTLSVATHYGSFRVRDGLSPQRVGALAQDFMGLTVTGADQFLASGHPDPADRQQPPHLGLLRSIDAGQSWELVSQKGSADSMHSSTVTAASTVTTARSGR